MTVMRRRRRRRRRKGDAGQLPPRQAASRRRGLPPDRTTRAPQIARVHTRRHRRPCLRLKVERCRTIYTARTLARSQSEEREAAGADSATSPGLPDVCTWVRGSAPMQGTYVRRVDCLPPAMKVRYIRACARRRAALTSGLSHREERTQKEKENGKKEEKK